MRSSMMPVTARIARAVDPSMSWFLGENASMEGGMIVVFSGSSVSHVKARREKM